jgi:DNA-binding GntR family transcriptional regulator
MPAPFDGPRGDEAPGGDAALNTTLEALSRRIGAKTAISGQIAQAIRELILAGGLAPGERIVESRFARRLRVGQPTVREALIELEHQGLVSRIANRGCVVTALSRAEIADALVIRGELERLAVELAVQQASDAALERLHALARRLADLAARGDAQAFSAQDQAFHELLWHISGNTCLPKVLAQIMLPLLAFLFIRHARHRDVVDLEHSARIHLELVEAIGSRDVERARAVAIRAFGSFAREHLGRLDARQGQAG